MEAKKHTALIVEDHELNREILCEILNDEYNIYTAVNGQECMQILHDHPADIDVVLLDIIMPIMNGYEVLKAVREDVMLKEIPIVVMTGADAYEQELRCLELGATDFLRKPYDTRVIHLRLSNIIHLRESTQANRQKTMFINNINHEIRTPLNAIMGFSQLLGLPPGLITDDEREKYVGYIVNNSKMLTWMIEDALALSDADNRMLHLTKTDVKINEVCQTALETVKMTCPETVTMYFTTDVPDDYMVNTDGNRVQQIIVNFLNNARKNTTEGEIHIHCSITENEGYCTLSVADTGIGIPADKAEYIFERFVKLNSFKPGSGLGLSIVKQLAQLIDAKVYLDTTYTNGARFALQIPIVSKE